MTSNKFLYVLAAVLLICGCGNKVENVKDDRLFFTVDFEQNKPLRYRFTSSRQTLTIFGDQTTSENKEEGRYN